MEIESNSRQMPSQSYIVREKNYCDILYAWIQCNSERVDFNTSERKIEKKKVKWAAIERDFIRINPETGEEEKVMSRKTIAKYFQYLVERGLIYQKEEDSKYYYLTVLGRQDANLIEYRTLTEMMYTCTRNLISVYIYLFNRYYANGMEPFIATHKQIKEFIGIATSTTSNNAEIIMIINWLQKRLKLLDMEYTEPDEQNRRYMRFLWVKNKFPDTE